MPLTRWLEAGLVVGLGSDISGGPDASLFSVMRAGGYAQMARRSLAGEAVRAPSRLPPLNPLEWLRLGTLDGARALGLDDSIGSLEVGKEADLIAIDAVMTAPMRGGDGVGSKAAEAAGSEAAGSDDAESVVGRLIFRAHPDMVRAAWVRGRRLAGPGGTA